METVNTTNGGLRGNTEKQYSPPMSDTETPYLKIGQRLMAVRQAFTDDTQKVFAERNGFNPTQYNNWEKGARRITVDCAERLVERYGLSLDFIYLGKMDGLSEYARKAL